MEDEKGRESREDRCLDFLPDKYLCNCVWSACTLVDSAVALRRRIVKGACNWRRVKSGKLTADH